MLKYTVKKKKKKKKKELNFASCATCNDAVLRYLKARLENNQTKTKQRKRVKIDKCLKQETMCIIKTI
jgi:hypothetical protein